MKRWLQALKRWASIPRVAVAVAAVFLVVPVHSFAAPDAQPTMQMLDMPDMSAPSAAPSGVDPATIKALKSLAVLLATHQWVAAFPILLTLLAGFTKTKFALNLLNRVPPEHRGLAVTAFGTLSAAAGLIAAGTPITWALILGFIGSSGAPFVYDLFDLVRGILVKPATPPTPPNGTGSSPQ